MQLHKVTSPAFVAVLRPPRVYSGSERMAQQEGSMPSVIVKNPAVLSGEPVFRGTRVPFRALTDYLEGGDTLDNFLEQYPTVTREAAIAALEEARDSLVAHLG
jgi:uncharacterized protein (DUF433 family)